MKQLGNRTDICDFLHMQKLVKNLRTDFGTEEAIYGVIENGKHLLRRKRDDIILAWHQRGGSICQGAYGRPLCIGERLEARGYASEDQSCDVAGAGPGVLQMIG